MKNAHLEPAPSGALSPLRYPVFRAIWLATLVANFGSVIQSVGAAWLMTELSSSAQMVALVQSSVVLPILLLSLFAGAIADSYDRRRVMLFAQMLMFLASAALTVMAYQGWIEPVSLLLLTLLVGVGTSLNGPSWQASLRDQVPVRELPAAVALNSIGFNLARSLGPAIGGLLMALSGAALNFSINTLSYVALIIVLLRWKPAQHPPKREPLGQAIMRGLRFAKSSSPILRALLRALMFGAFTAGFWALMPLIARQVLHGTQTDYGLMLGAFGIGSIGGALLSTRGRRSFSLDRLINMATFVFCVGAIGTALSTLLGLTLCFMLLAGLGWVTALSCMNITVQLHAPPEIGGRCVALYHMSAFGSLAVFSYVWGMVADHSSVRAAVLISSGIGVFVPLISLKWPMANLPDDHGGSSDI
jgi:MFS family permease